MKGQIFIQFVILDPDFF